MLLFGIKHNLLTSFEEIIAVFRKEYQNTTGAKEFDLISFEAKALIELANSRSSKKLLELAEKRLASH